LTRRCTRQQAPAAEARVRYAAMTGYAALQPFTV
jgi:hypothetical protein